VTIKSQKDFWSGLMFLCVGIGFAIGATNYSMGTSARPGAGYFPLGLGVLTALLGAFILFESLTIETADGEPVGKIAWRPLTLIVLTIVVFGALLPRLGMFITIPILVVMASYAGDEFHWRGVLVSAAILTVFSWLIFIIGLKLTIPLWPVFITG
jgi:Tripartite tricarboxylate transporter TctB family